MRIILLLSLLLVALLTLRTANHPTTPTPHATVLRTTSYALNAAVLTNAACSAGALVTAAVPRGMESDACAPWSVAAFAITARLHVFGVGGYGREEWAYARGLAGKGVEWVIGGPQRWFETF